MNKHPSSNKNKEPYNAELCKKSDVLPLVCCAFYLGKNIQVGEIKKGSSWVCILIGCILYPDEQVSIIILSNNNIPIDGIRDTLAEIVFGELS